ncbi:SSI family serine proteinase inhibitor [Streptomyces sp. TG1A-8]|uniref:SSI family serine proteinase inhibitor n=1 Tax=Streptomyces sp. TG1A-8 TaxID=3051385 RepID=UPI00265C5D3B|nr:SSI family serine proteinase inhibitor [Streptomyces sp. TG1A-8]MDO0926956.1 SSI family serine proteinase inhibitor [Streptomyces sp. TG1A-8]
MVSLTPVTPAVRVLRTLRVTRVTQAVRAVPRAVLVAFLAAVSPLLPLAAVPAAAAPAVPPPVRPEDRGGDHLTVVVRYAGPGRDGTYDVSCHPDTGRHPDLAGACRVLDARTRWGRDAFAPVDPGSVCTLLYGGPATAHVTGTWAGRPVDATYGRGNGCEIARWDRMVPFLPDLGTSARPA